MLYLLVLFILLAETAAMSSFKEYRITLKKRYLAMGYAGYVFVCLMLVQTFGYEDMGIVNVLWSAFSVLLVVFTGYFFFKEPVTRREIVGMCLVLIGVAMLPNA